MIKSKKKKYPVDSYRMWRGRYRERNNEAIRDDHLHLPTVSPTRIVWWISFFCFFPLWLVDDYHWDLGFLAFFFWSSPACLKGFLDEGSKRLLCCVTSLLFSSGKVNIRISYRNQCSRRRIGRKKSQRQKEESGGGYLCWVSAGLACRPYHLSALASCQ